MTRLPGGRPPAPVEFPEELNYASARAEVEAPGVPVAHYLWVLRRHKWRILGFVFVVVMAALVYSLQMTPVYQTSAVLEIDNQAQMFQIGQGAFRFDNRNFDGVVATQIQVMSSPEIARQVIRELRLDRNPDFNPAVRRRAAKPGQPATAPPAAEVSVLPGLSIRRRPETYLLEVGYRSTNPQLAASIANAAARAFVEQGFASQFQNSAELNKWLNRQLDEVKAKLERSQERLRAFEREHSTPNVGDRTNLVNVQLQHLQEEYTRTRSERVRKEALFRGAESGGMEALTITEMGEPLARVADRVETLETALSEAGEQYGPNHPNYKRLEAQVARARSQLEAGRKTVISRLEADYQQAWTRERAMADAVAAQRAELDRLSNWASDYSILKQEVDSQTKLYDELLRKVNETSINATIKASNLRLVSLAQVPAVPVAPRVQLNVLLALLLATSAAVGVALAADYLDRTLRSSEQVEQWLNLPVLATLPRVAGRKASTVLLGSIHEPLESRAVSKSGLALTEAISMLRTSVLLSAPASSLQMVLVASAAPAEGKSTVASGLALTLAQQLENGSRVLLVDSDMRRPTVHTVFGLPNRVGLSTLLDGQSKISESILPSEVTPNLMILPAGPSPGFSSEMLTMHMSKVLAGLRQEFRYIVVDSPPLLVAADATILSTMADGVLLVTRAGETPRDAVSAALRQLRRVRAQVLGLVLNQVNLPDTPGYGRYYGGYYYSKKENAEDG